MPRIITATWVSTGEDQAGNPVQKYKWDAVQYPDFVEWLLTVYKMDADHYIQRTSVIQSLPVQVAMRPANATDPVDTSHVVIYVIDASLSVEEADTVAVQIKAELANRAETGASKGFELSIHDRVEEVNL